MGRVKIGPMKAYKIMQELNGANNVGGTVVDYKNQSRKVNCFIEKDDAQMVVDKYLHRMKDAPTLTFEFICEKGKLVSLFWADEAAKANYREFGDVVSFDATFRTNKYHMVFVHFTTIDNHRKSVTFAIGLLSSETTESYVWLLKTFLKTFGKQPTVVLTDEDAAMKIAIERILSDSRHRLSMDRQRHNQCYLDHLSNIFKIKSKISLKIMEHAADIYTNEVFIKVKKEIEQSLFSCSQYSVTNEEFYDRFVVMQYKDIMGSTPTVVNEEDSESEYDVPEKTYFFKVVYDKKESSFECSRSLFFQNGILCRHIFCIFRTYQINKIPSKYILRRWCKGVIPSEVLMKQCLNDETSSSSSLLYDPLSRQVLIFVEESVSSLSKDTDKLKEFFELIKEAKLKVDGVCSTSISSNSLLKIKDIFEFVESSYGVKKPSISDIGNPSDDISNKGCGTGKRLKGAREKAITE
ncbi:protein FAR1-RELATED SEQUENCE 5-like [Lactuca sativa]|uniref:protein FAR1-RELATED SEQUENCE 5-like n=1 Tax=Lactuca sativa TaxID=4236 RepID=UPI000CD7F335|nr:protein FAR1-RELATED SEQUENCE 5-like [Lactuca sativa]